MQRALEEDHPEPVISRMRSELQARKVVVDWSQNNANKTTAAPYPARGRSRPRAAAPQLGRRGLVLARTAGPHCGSPAGTDAARRPAWHARNPPLRSPVSQP
ncbi:hypothetical protein [Arthrobacter sp. SDTb3-6]|uniref:non-homologous end-joining DNA ligase LigD n=1 Tax=unclassified Arthrobacter TaxID=235627 RepID=UPI0035250647